MSQSAIDVQSYGSSPVAVFEQTQTDGAVNVQQIAIVDPSGTGSSAIGATVDSNGLHVVPVVGSNNQGTASASAIASGGNSTLTSSADVTNGKTGTLQHAIFSATQPTLWQLQTVNNSGSPTTVAQFLTNANEVYDYKPGTPTELATVLSTGTATFQVVANNLSTNESQTSNAYAAFFWAEN